MPALPADCFLMFLWVPQGSRQRDLSPVASAFPVLGCRDEGWCLDWAERLVRLCGGCPQSGAARSPDSLETDNLRI